MLSPKCESELHEVDADHGKPNRIPPHGVGKGSLAWFHSIRSGRLAMAANLSRPTGPEISWWAGDLSEHKHFFCLYVLIPTYIFYVSHAHILDLRSTTEQLH